MAATYNLDNIIDNLNYPVNGSQIVRVLNENNFPQEFMQEFEPMIKSEQFDSRTTLHEWLSDHLTTHMAGLLGGASVHDLISKAKKTA
ncbi:MAG TPA: hypothetical protein VGK02_03340 [Candidatus Aquicultor sp.]|jgi:hypothetical protein